MTIGLTALVERYLTERRTLGFQLRSTAYSLRSLAEYVRRIRHRGPLTLEVMAEWARLDSHASVDPRTWARRLKHLRSFARWMQQFEPSTEVPDDTIFGRLPERQAPHIYSPEEVQQLLAAARELGPSPGLRGLVYETLFGLIASCGLRLNATAQEVLRRQLGKHRERVFTYAGKPLGHANTLAWRKALKRAGIANFRWHDLRHTWASWHRQSGTPTHELQRLGGWRSSVMVERYAHLAPDHLAKAAGRLDPMIRGYDLATPERTKG